MAGKCALIAVWSALLCLISLARPTSSSFGDQMIFYQNCIKKCLTKTCISNDLITAFSKRQHPVLLWMGWDCFEECKYNCQWITINALLHEDLPIPQFHGKWTFIRFLGFQEPASVLFSLCNLVAVYVGWRRYHRRISSSTIKDNGDAAATTGEAQTDDPYFVINTLNAILAMNAWFWSTVFHSHDFPMTEKMDYFSAYSLVLFSLFAVVVRIVDELIDSIASLNAVQAKPKPASPLRHLTIAIPFVAFFAYHIHFLSTIYFDYGYNMQVNVWTGITGSLLWLLWCAKHYFIRTYWQPAKDHEATEHIKRAALSIIAMNAFLSLELFDFEPLLFTFDAHSLWHAATVFFPLQWFRFLSDEALWQHKISRLSIRNLDIENHNSQHKVKLN